MEYKDLQIITADMVYEPSEDSFLAAEMITEILKGLDNADVLDMGTGTGILGLVAATSKNSKRVTFVDINPNALSLARRNSKENKKLLHAELLFKQSDLFSDLEDEKYDLIIFNAPYLKSEDQEEEVDDDIRWSGGEEGVEESVSFLQGAVTHLKSKGSIVLVASSLSNAASLKAEIADLGFSIIKEKKTHYFFEDIIVWQIGNG
jgi:release factor glutamine methyltransferase